MNQKIKYLTQIELQKFFSEIEDKRDKAIFFCMYKYGLRIGEVKLINIEDLDFEEKKITIKRLKTARNGGKLKEYEYKLYKSIEKEIKAYLKIRGDQEGPLFLSRNKNGISPTRLDFLFRKYAQKAKIQKKKQHCHVLRHSIAVHLLDAGVTPPEIQYLLGHAKIETTMIYANLSERKLAKTYDLHEKSAEIVSI